MPEQACRALTLKSSLELPGTVEAGSVKDTVAEVAVEDVMVALAAAPLPQPRVWQSVSYAGTSFMLYFIDAVLWNHG